MADDQHPDSGPYYGEFLKVIPYLACVSPFNFSHKRDIAHGEIVGGIQPHPVSGFVDVHCTTYRILQFGVRDGFGQTGQ